MTPRVFISSTYYDLKHVRERLELFLNNYGFEAILFESDKVTYEIGKPIDQSAYNEVKMCHVMILIVGGRYGTISSTDEISESRKRYNDYYISITRKEYEAAANNNIPVLIFVEKTVYSEYLTYSENKALLDLFGKNEPPSSLRFKFAHVDDINVFKFIDFFGSKAIKTFEKVEEIESYIKSQFSGMFYLYLESLKQKSETTRILNTIEELNNVAGRMNEMLNSVGKKILGTSNDDYQSVIDSQYEMLINFFTERIRNEISFANTVEEHVLEEINFDEVARLFYEEVLRPDIRIQYTKNFSKFHLLRNGQIEDVMDDLNSKLQITYPVIIFSKLNVYSINNLFWRKILPFIKSEQNHELLIKEIARTLKFELSDLPF